ncbi:MAG: 4-alpha-glucanotransferase, partial [Prevotella sp.]|nr:4-alpha-glucanotransferase [Prevotella sp.]
MKLRFGIQYGTAWGENVHVVIEYKRKDGNVKRHNHQMNTQDGQWWTLEVAAMESRQHPIESFRYYYQIEDSEGNVLRKEWDMVARLYAFDSTKDFIFTDAWRDIPVQQHLYTNAYLTTIGGVRNETTQALRIPLYRKTLLFVVLAPQLKCGQSVAVCGSHPAIGCWNTSRYLKMQYAGQQRWILAVNIADMMLPLEYKYVVVDDSNGDFVAWEEGDNRSTSDSLIEDGQVVVLDGGTIRLMEDLWRAAGVVVPVFSLRSEQSYGVGDFGDLKRMVDWVSSVGMKVI